MDFGIKPLRRVDTTFGDSNELANVAYNDKYVLQYDFGVIDDDELATSELTTLLKDLQQVGLTIEVRPGYDKSILVFVQAPRALLRTMVYRSRYGHLTTFASFSVLKGKNRLISYSSVKDWLYGIVRHHPRDAPRSCVSPSFEAEDILSVYHLIHWGKDMGGAGITPQFGRWKNVTAVYALHNGRTNRELLARLSKRIFLSLEDLDEIRNLWGPKTAFYFAFIQTYFRSLLFPCLAGIFAWAFLPKYSLLFALIIGAWCTVFLEYWKIKQTDLAIRWNVRGVGDLKTNRPQFHYERTVIDSAGRVMHHFPRRKRILRQLVVVPFVLISTLFLGALITFVFAIETFLSEAYDGPYKFYLEYLPTMLLAVFLPYATNFLEDIATSLTEYENHRTADHYEMSLTQKIFVLNGITNYLPIFLTAFIYVPFGEQVMPLLQWVIDFAIGPKNRSGVSFEIDPDKLRNAVITLTLTGQVSGAVEELALPWLKTHLKQWWHDRQDTNAHKRGQRNHRASFDAPGEGAFLRQARRQALRPAYNVQDDIAEMVIQFGYLALFSPVWPLVPIGFLINNWFELRSDFLKICYDHQRPAPVRSDGIGPWVTSLEILSWAGSISSAAIVHLFGSHDLVGSCLGLGRWASLPLTILLSEHIFMGFRAVVRMVLGQIGSEQTRKEKAERYMERKRHLEDLEASEVKPELLAAHERERRRTSRIHMADLFWTRQIEAGASEEAGVQIIREARKTQDLGKKNK